MSWNSEAKYGREQGMSYTRKTVGEAYRMIATKINWVRVGNKFLFEGEKPVFSDPNIAENWTVLMDTETDDEFKNRSQMESILDMFLAPEQKVKKMLQDIYAWTAVKREVGRKIDKILKGRAQWNPVPESESGNKISIEIFARKQYHKALRKLIKEVYGLPVMLINGDETNNSECEDEANLFIEGNQRKNVVFIADGMGSRSFSVPSIKFVLLMFDSGSEATLMQKVARALTENDSYEECTIIDYRTKFGATPDKIGDFLSSCVDKGKTSWEIVKNIDHDCLTIWDCFLGEGDDDETCRYMTDESLAKMLSNCRTENEMVSMTEEFLMKNKGFVDMANGAKVDNTKESSLEMDERVQGKSSTTRSKVGGEPGDGQPDDESSNDDNEPKPRKVAKFISNFITNCSYLTKKVGEVKGSEFIYRWERFVEDGGLTPISKETKIDEQYFDESAHYLNEKYGQMMNVKVLSFDKMGDDFNYDFE